ncbi:MAG TPA: hypothetical protein VFH17_06255, partial [Coriobacteriia bacterium]|nr:hypothetical protein [Coriobacteriia bacterium]
MRTLIAAVVLGAWMVLALMPGSALAQTAGAGTTAGVAGYDVDFTVPSAAKAGCMVCHGDENLATLRDGEVAEFWVDAAELEAGPHAAIQCVGCHLDFAFTLPHVPADADWRATAKSACKNCHQEQYLGYVEGVHRPVAEGDGAAPRPLCGECHGAHDIVALTDDPAGVQALRRDAFEVCGRCHEEEWESYDDAYHGRAFKRGAEDAPACWDCHGYHEVWPAEDRRSLVHENRIAETCSGEGACHDDVNE